MDVMGQEPKANRFSRQAGERIWNGVVKENPTFVLMLGMCPTLAVTTSAINGLGMGLSTAVVLIMSNLLISLLRNVIPNKVRIPAFIVIIASFVTILQLLLEGYLPALNEALGVYIPLIVVNCIILGRAESYASLNPPLASLFDGLGMGLGFTIALTCIGAVREVLGAGKLFNLQVMPSVYTPIGIFVLAPGAFFVLAALAAIQNYVRNKKGDPAAKQSGDIHIACMGDCSHCSVMENTEYVEAVDYTAHRQKEQNQKNAGKTGGGKMADGKIGGGKIADGKTADGKIADGKITDGKIAGRKSEKED
jgi:electron transport complex protein RnfE